MLRSVVLIVMAILYGLSLGAVFLFLPREPGNHKKNTILGCAKLILFSACCENIKSFADSFEASMFIDKAAFLIFICIVTFFYIGSIKRDSNT